MVSVGGPGLDERLDEDKLETLRSWGAGLSADRRDEVRAAGRAIVLLVEEIEHLHVDLWHARATGPTEPAGDAEAREPSSDELPETLRERLARRFPRPQRN
jgi:hypothetical protein